MSGKIAAVPRGFRTVTPCLTVKGADQAIEFYKAAFGAVEQSRLYNADGTAIIHAAMKIGNSMVFFAEESPGQGILSPATLGYSPTLVHLYVANADEFWANAIAAGATEIMPLTDTYWGDRFGKLADPYGHYWSVASRIEKVTQKELIKRTKAATRVHNDVSASPELAA